MEPFEKLMKMIEACARSDAKIKFIEDEYNYGHITAEECIDAIVMESARIKQELDLIRIGKKQFIKERNMEVSYEQN